MKKFLTILTLISSSAFAAPTWDCTAFVKDSFDEMVDINIVAVEPMRLMVTRKRDSEKKTHTTFLGVLAKKPVIIAKGGYGQQESIVVDLELQKSGVLQGRTFYSGKYIEYDKKRSGKPSLIAVNFECEYLR